MRAAAPTTSPSGFDRLQVEADSLRTSMARVERRAWEIANHAARDTSGVSAALVKMVREVSALHAQLAQHLDLAEKLVRPALQSAGAREVLNEHLAVHARLMVAAERARDAASTTLLDPWLREVCAQTGAYLALERDIRTARVAASV